MDKQFFLLLLQKREKSVVKYLKIYVYDFFVFITLQLQFLFVFKNKIIKWAALKKKEKETIYFENGSNRLVGDTGGEGQWVMVSVLPPPTHEGRALSWLPGNRAQRTASSSVGPVGRESGSANCCHLGTRTQQTSAKSDNSASPGHYTITLHPKIPSLLLYFTPRDSYFHFCACAFILPWFFNGKGIVSLSLLRRFFISLISLQKTKITCSIFHVVYFHTQTLE